MRYYLEAVNILQDRLGYPFGEHFNAYTKALKTSAIIADKMIRLALYGSSDAQHTKNAGLWIAVKDNHVVAVVHHWEWNIDRMATHRAHEKKGYMTELINHITRHFITHEDDLTLCAAVDNSKIPFFRKLGWIVAGDEAPDYVKALVTDNSGLSRAMLHPAMFQFYEKASKFNKQDAMYVTAKLVARMEYHGNKTIKAL